MSDAILSNLLTLALLIFKLILFRHIAIVYKKPFVVFILPKAALLLYVFVKI